jgi:hypothetical protein
MSPISISRMIITTPLLWELVIASSIALTGYTVKDGVGLATTQGGEPTEPTWHEVLEHSALSPALLDDLVRRRVGLSFPTLESIPLALANQLSALPVDNAFPAATSLPPGIAHLLVTPDGSKFHRLLVISSLREIDHKTAAVLGTHCGGLGLDGIAHLDSEQVRRISHCTGVLSLRGLSKLPTADARFLWLRADPTLLSDVNRTAAVE